jgi:hypothetical protein
MAKRSTKILVALAVVAAVAVGATLAVRSLWSHVTKSFAGDSCTIGSYDLAPEQASVAAAMVGAVTRYRVTLPDRAAVLVLAAALQESKLQNLKPGEGDRDSVGVLQQRPSQGWGGGSAAKLMDITEATTEFLDRLVKLPHWQTLPLAEAVQSVQISADGSLYAQHEPEAAELTRVLRGRTPAGITCTLDKPSSATSATAVAAAARKELGISSPRAASPTVVRAAGAGWQTVAWFVANAKHYGVEEVRFDGRTWTRSKGWRKTPSVTGAAVAAMLYAPPQHSGG